MKPFSHNEEGQVVVLVAIGLTMLGLMAGLATDIGHLRYKRQQMQKAADAGALAASSTLLLNDYLNRPWWKEPIFCKAGGATGCAILRRAW